MNRLSNPEKWILFGIPALFFIGAFFHFLYEFSGNSQILAAITPINESVWEHCKMLILPTIGWWGLYYLFMGNTYSISTSKWLAGMLASLLASVISMPLIFYFYTSAFGFESIVIDIIILLIAVLIGQLIGLHVFRYSTCAHYELNLSFIILIFLLFVIFTYYPPDLPIFQE